MRFIAIIAVVAIIVVGVIIALVLANAKEARIGKFKALQDDRNYYRDQFYLTRDELQTIVDTDGEGAALTAQLALDEIDRKFREYNDKKELENA